ncbi:MAG: bifunctional 5,10-methylenetetrahydrofolate dehydrogenase/5,10-methenyltetrahydrofolate cyclohydrolase [Patescibacteria group bacterium]|nr:bifunctional 5,10-methylenetetrahydrofolate dehydrogenase/5,10-methenyltetrahydrofolate cyclohydrolase [Patescibacteria group bacterium]
MKVSGKAVAAAISKKLQKKIEKLTVKPTLAIILVGEDPSSRMYVDFKIKAAKRIGVGIKFYEFSEDQYRETLKTIQKLNADKQVHGIIIQYPIYKSWDFDELFSAVDPEKDVDGFHENSPFGGATAIGVWEMLTAFALIEGFKKTEEFLKDKKIVVLGRGKTAGGPIIKLLGSHGLQVTVVAHDTENPQSVIKSGDVIISATGVKNIVNKTNLKNGSFVIGVGVGKEIVDGQSKVYGDINEEDVEKIAKLYCPTIGGIGPLTIVSLLENTIEASIRQQKKD